MKLVFLKILLVLMCVLRTLFPSVEYIEELGKQIR